MSDKENRRKCIKCGCSPYTDNIKLFRFPKPGVRNLIRCELWAQYMFPEGEFSSITFQSQLHNEHRMLCQNHFLPGDFTDDSLKTLRRSAVPHDVEHQLSIYHVEPQAGPSQMVLQDVSNVQNVQPSSSVASQSQAKLPKKTEKEKFLYAKCSKYMQKICQLRNRIKSLKSKQMLKRITDDISMKKLSEKISPTFACLLQGQIRNFKKKITGRR